MRCHKIALFFTFGTALKTWQDSGLLHREVKPYLEMAKLGHKITFYTYGDARDLSYKVKYPAIQIIPLYQCYKYKKSDILNFLNSLLFVIKNRKMWTKYDYIKSNQMWGAWAPLLAAKISGTFFLARVGYDLYEFQLNKQANPFKKIFIKYLSWLVYKFSNKILCTSKQTKNFIIEKFKIPNNKIHYHSNYIDTDLFRPADDRSFSPHILYVGRLDSHKNIALMINAAALAKVEIHIIGDGEEKESLQRLAEKTKCVVKYLGKIPNQELAAVLKTYSLFSITSKSEGNPKALLEAMSCGLCPIGVNTPGIKDIITPQNGFLVEPNVKDLSSVYVSIIKNADNIASKRENARQYILDNCGLKSLIELESNIFELNK